MATLPGLQAWVERQLRPVASGESGRIIHDPLLGTNFFAAHEIARMDTPLLQRLRPIAQTALADLVYPGARHSRFAHTLGTVALVERYVRTLRAHGRRGDNPLIAAVDRWELNLAALLHDVGHAFFSHSSEAPYGCLPELQQYRDARHLSEGRRRVGVSGHRPDAGIPPIGKGRCPALGSAAKPGARRPVSRRQGAIPGTAVSGRYDQRAPGRGQARGHPAAWVRHRAAAGGRSGPVLQRDRRAPGLTAS